MVDGFMSGLTGISIPINMRNIQYLSVSILFQTIIELLRNEKNRTNLCILRCHPRKAPGIPSMGWLHNEQQEKLSSSI